MAKRIAVPTLPLGRNRLAARVRRPIRRLGPIVALPVRRVSRRASPALKLALSTCAVLLLPVLLVLAIAPMALLLLPVFVLALPFFGSTLGTLSNARVLSVRSLRA